jgi:hypothetical protein
LCLPLVTARIILEKQADCKGFWRKIVYTVWWEFAQKPISTAEHRRAVYCATVPLSRCVPSRVEVPSEERRGMATTDELDAVLPPKEIHCLLGGGMASRVKLGYNEYTAVCSCRSACDRRLPVGGNAAAGNQWLHAIRCELLRPTDHEKIGLQQRRCATPLAGGRWRQLLERNCNGSCNLSVL